MKTFTLSFFLIVALFSLFGHRTIAQKVVGQYSITGTVSDSASSKKLDFITANLMSDPNTVIKVDYTKENGSFSFIVLKPAKYTVVIVGVGYRSKSIVANLTDSTQKILDLGNIILSAETIGLKEVKVVAAKPIVSQEVDRISYDMQADPESKVNSVLDMIRKVPLLSVDADNNIYMKGNQDFKILINGKPSSMMERNYRDILRSMPASSIVKIEVITTPPSKYDAEGLAGIINIITNKKIDNGYNGSLNASHRFPAGGPGMGGSVTARFGKFGLSAFGGASVYNTPVIRSINQRETTGEVPSLLTQPGTEKQNSRSGYMGYELSYELDSLNLFSGQFNLNGDRFNNWSLQESNLVQNDELYQRYVLRNNFNGNGLGLDGGFNYQRGFKKDKNRMLTFSYRFYGYKNDRTNNIGITDQVNYDMPDYRQYNDQSFGEQTAQVDFVYPLKKLSIEAGVKGIFRSNKSKFQTSVESGDGGDYVVDPSLSNDFNNQQNVFGAYNTYQYNLKKFTLKVGVRVEQTIIKADFMSTDSKVSRNYFNIIPSVSMSRKINDKTNFNLGYSQRIQRPGIWQLNPFVDKSNPNFERTGNPNLRPALVNDIQLGFTWSKKISINGSLGFTYFKDLIFQVLTYDSTTNITRTSYGNTGTARLPMLNMNINYPITKKWNASFNARVAYGFVEGQVNGKLIKNKGAMYGLSLTTGYRFEKGWRANASFYGNGPNLSFQGTTNAFFSNSFSVNKDLITDKLTLSASVNNPFNKYRYNHRESFGTDFTQYTDRWDYFRSFNFSVNYKFGKLKDGIKKSRRGIRNDDVQNGG